MGATLFLPILFSYFWDRFSVFVTLGPKFILLIASWSLLLTQPSPGWESGCQAVCCNAFLITHLNLKFRFGFTM